jgi:hypothetical protein
MRDVRFTLVLDWIFKLLYLMLTKPKITLLNADKAENYST